MSIDILAFFVWRPIICVLLPKVWPPNFFDMASEVGLKVLVTLTTHDLRINQAPRVLGFLGLFSFRLMPLHDSKTLRRNNQRIIQYFDCAVIWPTLSPQASHQVFCRLVIQQPSDFDNELSKALLVGHAHAYACKQNFRFQLGVFFDLF